MCILQKAYADQPRQLTALFMLDGTHLLHYDKARPIELRSAKYCSTAFCFQRNVGRMGGVSSIEAEPPQSRFCLPSWDAFNQMSVLSYCNCMLARCICAFAPVAAHANLMLHNARSIWQSNQNFHYTTSMQHFGTTLYSTRKSAQATCSASAFQRGGIQLPAEQGVMCLSWKQDQAQALSRACLQKAKILQKLLLLQRLEQYDRPHPQIPGQSACCGTFASANGRRPLQHARTAQQWAAPEGVNVVYPELHARGCAELDLKFQVAAGNGAAGAQPVGRPGCRLQAPSAAG